MDFDIGNILYVVITLVAIIAGLLGKKKKPSNQSPEETESEAQPGFLENLERVLRMGQENPQVTDLQEYEEDIAFEETGPLAASKSEVVTETVASSGSILDDYDRIMKRDTNFGDGDPVESLDLVDLDQEGEVNYFEIVKDFDAGTAVVYSAIINRLDY